jgi:small multidrug resistance family-3 protein
MTTIAAYVIAALAEISGCFAFWAWLRLGKSIWWLVLGASSLALFAWALTWVDSPGAGRGYAGYGGVYIAASLAWLWLGEAHRGAARWIGAGPDFSLMGVNDLLGYGRVGRPYPLARSQRRARIGSFSSLSVSKRDE